MNVIDSLLDQPAAQAIGWALLQFIWQGTLIGILTAAALAALRRSAADIRYVVAAIGLSLMLTMPVVTAVQTWHVLVGSRAVPILADPPGRTWPAAVASSAYSSELATARSGNDAVVAVSSVLAPDWRFDPWIPVLVLSWLCGVAVLTLRLLSGWLWVQRMTSYGASPAPEAIRDMAGRLARRLHISRVVSFLESTAVEVPTVIGWLRPVVLVPASALASLAPHQLEAILAHELAHIRRHDYLVNLLQTLVETLLFYHPAVWWLSRRIRIERENCCDDLAVSLCGDPVIYARALAELEELRGEASHFALAATGGSLLQRVRRLLGAPTHAGRGPGWLAGTVVILVMVGIAAGAVGGDLSQSSARSVAPGELSTGGDESRDSFGEPARAISVAPPATATAPDAPLPRERGEELHRAAEAAGRQAMLADAPSTVLKSSASFPPAPRQSQGNFTWSNGKEKLQVNYSGSIEFTEDDTDVRSLSPGGWLKITDGGLVSRRTVELRADADGHIGRRYWVGFSERPFDPDGRRWLAESLPRFIRQTGLGAAGRVARIYRTSGTDGVLAEIARIEGSWGRRLYFTELLKQNGLEQKAVEQIVVQAGRQLTSDFELASFLIDTADRLLVDDATKSAYFEAVRRIRSDFEMRRVYSSALKRGPLSSELLAAVLDGTTEIESDFEQATLLIEIAKLQALDARTRPVFFKTLGGVGSAFEHRRVLSALVGGDLQDETMSAVLESGALLRSDFEKASLLVELLKRRSIEPARTPFFRTVDTIGSAHERGRVLQALLKRPDVSGETVVGILGAVRGMTGSFESAQVLIAVAGAHPISGEARDIYITAAERLGEYEQGRVLTALVKNERRR